MSAPDRPAMLDRAHPGCRSVASAGCSGWRARTSTDPLRPPTEDLVILRRLDELFLAWPFFGSRRMTAMLRGEGQRINRKRVRRLMRLMGLTALGPKPQTTKPAPGHKIYPYLLRGLVIDRANQVWAADITYVPIGRGFLYLVAIMDWASRAVLAWRLSNTLDADFCVRALEEALARFGRPAIFNTDQGSQFTAPPSPVLQRRAFGSRWTAAGVGWTTSSSSGCGALKYEEVYLKSYADGREARAGIAEWMAFYNHWRPHQALANRTPMAVWRGGATRARGGCGYDAALGQRWRVAHIPTAAATASLCSLTISGDRTVALPTKKPAPLVPRTGSTLGHRPHLVGPLDRHAAQQIRIDLVARRRLRRVRPAIERRDPHAPHHPRDPLAADHDALDTLDTQQIAQPPAARERAVEMQLVDPPHHHQIGRRHWPGPVAEAASAQL